MASEQQTKQLDENSPQNRVAELLDTVTTMQTSMKNLSTELKKLQKDINKMAKAQKPRRKPEPNPDRPKTGFAKPTKLSKDLCEFLKVEPSTEIARTEVTRMINTYIKDNKLQNPENKRQIILDAPLKKLLNPPEGEDVTYFTLQSYMKVHFIAKSESTQETPATTPATTPVTTPATTPSPTPPQTPQKTQKKVVVRTKKGAANQVSVTS
tara:strand:- start:1330 stop:1959 length:630 start_codon:yes stop_codon:yes gene_type:complete